MAVTVGELDRRAIFHIDRPFLAQNRSPGCLYNKIIKTKSQDLKQVHAFRAKKHNRFKPDAREAFAITKPTVALSVSFFAAVMLIISLAMSSCSFLDVDLSIVRPGSSTWTPLETIGRLTRRKQSWTICVTIIKRALAGDQIASLCCGAGS